MGSGTLIKKAILKYGIENFEKTILFTCSSKEQMDEKEREIVNESFIKRDDVYNLKIGGEGGWDFINHSDSHNNKHNHRRTGYVMIGSDGKNSGRRVIDSYTKEEYKSYCDKISDGVNRYISENGGIWLGKHHTEDTKQKMSEKAKLRTGERNSSFGTMWIYNKETYQSMKIKNTDPIPNGWERGRKIKKI